MVVEISTFRRRAKGAISNLFREVLSIYCFSQLLITGGHRVGTFFSLTSVINEYIGIFVMGIFLLMVSYYATSPSYKIAKEDGFFHGIYFFIFYLIEFSIPITLFLAIPYLLENHFALKELANWIRWFEIFVAGVIYFKLRKHAETRGLYSFLGHYALLLFAWFIDRWVGIIFIALPLLFVYYHVMSRIAFEIMPASNPDDKKEKNPSFGFSSHTRGDYNNPYGKRYQTPLKNLKNVLTALQVSLSLTEWFGHIPIKR